MNKRINLSATQIAELKELAQKLDEDRRSESSIPVIGVTMGLLMLAMIAVGFGCPLQDQLIGLILAIDGVIIFLYFFFMPTTWLNRRIKKNNSSYEELKKELEENYSS